MGLLTDIKEYAKAYAEDKLKRETEELRHHSQGGSAPPQSPPTAGPPPAWSSQPSVAFPQPQPYPHYPPSSGDLSNQFLNLNIGSGYNGSPYGGSVPNVLTPGSQQGHQIGQTYTSGAVDEFVPPLRNPVPRPPAMIPDPFGNGSGMLAPHGAPYQLSSSVPPMTQPGDGASLPPPPMASPSAKFTRASSEPPPTSNSVSNGSAQCSGITKSNKRCTRRIKLSPTAQLMAADGEEVAVYCHAHQKEILQVSGFNSRGTAGAFVKYNAFIPQYLQDDTKVAIRTEMEKPVSDADVPGYIYCFQIIDEEHPDLVHLKVGRAVNLVKRIDEWTKQCGKGKEPILRGWYPGPERDGKSYNNISLLKGTLQVGAKGKHCHRMERLMHLELGDLMLYKPYKNDSFFSLSAGGDDDEVVEIKDDDDEDKEETPKAKGRRKPRAKAKRSDSEDAAEDYSESSSSSASASAGEKSKKRSKKSKPVRYPCPGCGQLHQEIFTFDRLDGGLTGKEWEKIVMPVVMKWGDFVNSHT